jgi:hypothetical protein
MTVLSADKDGFHLKLDSPRFTGPFPVTIQAPSGTTDRAPCVQSPSALQRLLQCDVILSVTATSPMEVRVDHVPLPDRPGETFQALLIAQVVMLLKTA